jgi:hypothetical protein
LCLNVSARLNLAVFYSCRDLSGSVFAFRVMDARLVYHTLHVWNS